MSSAEVRLSEARMWHEPLEIVGSRIFVLLVGAEGTDITRRVVNEAMTHHFVLTLEALSTGCSRTPLYGTKVWAFL